LCDDNLHSLWPGFMSDDAVDKLYQSQKRRGQLDTFYREYRNLPISTEDAVFRQEYFKDYSETDTEFSKIKHQLENVVIVDPAKTTKMHSAESALVCIGIDRHSARLYVRDIVLERFYPDELYNELFKMCARHRVRVFGVEVTSLSEFIVQPIKNEMMRRGQMMELIELKARGQIGRKGKGKEDRVAALVPYYRQGYVFHNDTCCKGLEAQLLSFPRSKLWDIMDATAYIVEMLELGGRYFEPPEFEDPEDEYKELYEECEPPIENWRLA